MYPKPHGRKISNEKDKRENDIEIVYLIVAHSDPELLGRLISALDANSAHFFVLVDRKADISTFLPFIPKKQNVHLSKSRLKVFWGGYSQVEATLNLMEEAISSGIEFKYAILLSGSHYPIKSNTYILNQLRNSNGEYLQFGTVDEIEKTNAYCFYDYALSNPRTVFFKNKLLNKIGRIPGTLVSLIFRKVVPIFHKRKLPRNIVAYTGANWWALTKPCVKHVLDYSEINKDYVDFFRFCIQPDETFFHTIICNSSYRIENSDITLQSLKGDSTEIGKFLNLRGLSLTFTKCSSNGVPKTLSEADVAEISKEFNFFSYPQLFARKFDSRTSCKLLDIIDKEILGHEYRP